MHKKLFLLSVASIALIFSWPAYAHPTEPTCQLKLGKWQDLNSWLFEYAAHSILAAENLADSIQVSGSLSDDNMLDAGRAEKPVERLLEIMRPTAFRRPKQNGIVRIIGDPCGVHKLDFEAVTQTDSEVWKLKVELKGGKIQSISADRYHYEVVQ